MQNQGRAILAMVWACVIWGSSSIYFAALKGVAAPGELLSHRVLWSLVVFVVLLAARGELRWLARVLRGPDLGRIALAAVMIAANWLIFIIAVYHGHFVAGSFGYYIFPLMSVLVGVVAFGERLDRLQWLAVALAAVAVLLLGVGLGVTPWVSLAIAASFAVYGAVKKGIDLPPRISVAAEMAVLAPVAAVWLVLRPEAGPQAGPLMGTGWQPLLLIGSSLYTALPMMLFTFAARRLDLATVGLMQYINPTLQFLAAVFWFREPFTRWHVIAFALIWLALGLFSGSALRRRRALPAGRAGL